MNVAYTRRHNHQSNNEKNDRERIAVLMSNVAKDNPSLSARRVYDDTLVHLSDSMDSDHAPTFRYILSNHNFWDSAPVFVCCQICKQSALQLNEKVYVSVTVNYWQTCFTVHSQVESRLKTARLSAILTIPRRISDVVIPDEGKRTHKDNRFLQSLDNNWGIAVFFDR